MAIDDIPVFREARRGQILRSDDWNTVQRALRNGVRTHRHTRPALSEPDDESTDDVAQQIGTNELADGAVTADKLSPEIRRGLSLPPVQTRALTSLEPTPTASTVTTGTVSLGARGQAIVDHGLGSVPVGVVTGTQQPMAGLTGEFLVYGASNTVIAAVPIQPDGTFALFSERDVETTVRWWAIAGTER